MRIPAAVLLTVLGACAVDDPAPLDVEGTLDMWQGSDTFEPGCVIVMPRGPIVLSVVTDTDPKTVAAAPPATVLDSEIHEDVDTADIFATVVDDWGNTGTSRTIDYALEARADGTIVGTGVFHVDDSGCLQYLNVSGTWGAR